MTFKPWNPIAFCLALVGAGPALAQSAERVAAHTDWSVFVASDPKECYIVSPPTTSVARRDGQPVEVQRGDIRLFVAFRPGENVSNEVSFTGGYPFRDGSTVTLAVGGDSFTLGPGQGDAGEWAWTDPADDSRVVAALRARRDGQADRHLVARHHHRGHLLADAASPPRSRTPRRAAADRRPPALAGPRQSGRNRYVKARIRAALWRRHARYPRRDRPPPRSRPTS